MSNGMQTTKQFYRHSDSGEIFAIEEGIKGVRLPRTYRVSAGVLFGNGRIKSVEGVWILL